MGFLVVIGCEKVGVFFEPRVWVGIGGFEGFDWDGGDVLVVVPGGVFWVRCVSGGDER